MTIGFYRINTIFLVSKKSPACNLYRYTPLARLDASHYYWSLPSASTTLARIIFINLYIS